jgi:hypothetical protein
MDPNEPDIAADLAQMLEEADVIPVAPENYDEVEGLFEQPEHQGEPKDE